MAAEKKRKGKENEEDVNLTIMEVVVSFGDTIKPSCPTPDHLRHWQLSFLDQLNARIFTSFVYFYSSSAAASAAAAGGPDELIRFRSNNNNTTLERLERLKESLSETLTVFYPLAGRLKDDLYIACNDEGVHYFEAQANCQLSQLIEQERPNLSEIGKLIPFSELVDTGDLLLAIQVNVFTCGGIAISLRFSHKLMDGSSMVMFLNNWAAASRRDPSSVVVPKFGTATLFPPRDMSGSFNIDSVAAKEKNMSTVTQNFVFSPTAISALRAKYTTATAPLVPHGSSIGRRSPTPSRVEALSVFIWSRFVAATSTTTGGRTAAGGDGDGDSAKRRWFRVIQAINMRPRANPPLPETLWGNVSQFAVAKSSSIENGNTVREEDCYGIVTKMREAIRKIDSEYIKKLQEGNMNVFSAAAAAANNEGGEVGVQVAFTFTGLNRFPFYEADFGWGRPIWVTLPRQSVKNVVLFLPSRSGDDGIEALIHVKEDDMAKLEADREFLSFVSPTSNKKVPFLSSL